jgi:hypothetical protein
MRLARTSWRFEYLPDRYAYECRTCGLSYIDAVWGRCAQANKPPLTFKPAAKLLTKDEARRIAANIAKLPGLLRQRSGPMRTEDG